MKKLLVLPTVIFPYLMCVSLGDGFFGYSFSDTSIAVFGIAALLVLIAAFICNIIYIFTTKMVSSEELVKTAFWVKVIHIPTYVIIYILGLMMGFMFFMTVPFIIFLVIIDSVTLWLSGILSLHSLVRSLKDNKVVPKAVLIVAIVCQFIFCADVISLFFFQDNKPKKANEQLQLNFI